MADFYLRHFALTRSHAVTQISFPSWVKFYCFDFAFFIRLAVFLDMDPTDCKFRLQIYLLVWFVDVHFISIIIIIIIFFSFFDQMISFIF